MKLTKRSSHVHTCCVTSVTVKGSTASASTESKGKLEENKDTFNLKGNVEGTCKGKCKQGKKEKTKSKGT